MNQRSQETHPSNEPVKATEIPQFSGVISADFVQRITRDHIKSPRAFLFSRYILSRIQRKLIPGIADVSVRNIAPCILTLAVGRRVSSEGALAPKDNHVNSLPSTSPLQPSLLRMPIENELRRSERVAAEGGLSTGQDEQRSGSNLLFSEAPSSILSVKPQQEGMISRDFPQRKEERVTESGSGYGFPDARIQYPASGMEQPLILSSPNLMTDFSLVSPKGESKLYDEQISEPRQTEASAEFSPTLQRISIPRKPIFSAPVSVNDASFADTVAERSVPEISTVGSDIPSRTARLDLTTLRAVEPAGSELIHVQRRVELPDASLKTREADIQPEERSAIGILSEWPQTNVSEALPLMPLSMPGVVSSGSMSIIDTSSADMIAGGSKPKTSTGKEALSRIGQLNLTTLRAAESTGSELIRAQRQVEKSDANAGARGTVIQLEERASTVQEVGSVPVSAVTDSVLNNRYSMLNRADVRASSYTQYPIRDVASETFIRSPFITRGGIARGETFQGSGGSVGVFRKSPTGEGTSVGALLRQADNVMRIFRQHVDMPHARLYSDTSANLMAAKLNAEAFTIGRDVFFASGKLNLSTARGIALLGHELTHVRQQEQGTARPSTGDISGVQYQALENEALTNEQTMLSILSIRPEAARSPRGDVPTAARKAENLGKPLELTHLNLPEIQSAMTGHISTPLMAQEGRGAEPATPAEVNPPDVSEPTAPDVDIERIAEEVYDIIERRLRSEKERRGYF